MNQGTSSFTDILNQYVMRSAYRPGQLARTGLPQMTIVNWLEGRVQQPRMWQDVLQLGRALHLDLAEINGVLVAAGYPPVKDLWRVAQDEVEQGLLTFWVRPNVMPAEPAPFQVIPDLPTFVGRENLLKRLRVSLLADYHEGAYLVTGEVGIGKTVLAVHVAYQLRDHFRDGVLWARLDTMSPRSILQLWATALGVDVAHYDDVDSCSTAVRQLLANKVDFSVEEAAIVTGVTLAQADDYLRTLFALCLVRRGQGKGRYRLILILQSFARNKLREN